MLAEKPCTRCGETKALEFFVKRSTSPLAYKGWCKQCENVKRKQQYLEQNEYRREKSRARYAENPIRFFEASSRWKEKNKETYAAYAHSWYKENPEKIKRSRMRRHAKMRGAGIMLVTEKEISSIKAKPCFYCGSMESIEVDHRIPVAKGGAHSIGNLVPACLKCNRSKNDKFVMEWRVWKIKRLSNAR